MPIMGIWSTFNCPPSLEGTSITLFTGYLNTSGNVSNYLGAILMKLTNINKSDYDKIWILIMI